VHPVEASIGGQVAAVLFAGLAPTLVGVCQVDLEVPTLPSGEHDLVVTVGGAPSNAAVVSVTAG